MAMNSASLSGNLSSSEAAAWAPAAIMSLQPRISARPALLSFSLWPPSTESRIPCLKAKKLGVSYSRRQATVCCGESYVSNGLAKNHVDNEVMQLARKAFCEEVHSRKQDETISVPKGALLIAAEDKAFVDLDKERDILALQNEGHSFSAGPRVTGIVNAGALPLGAMTIGGCMESFDDLLKEVEVHLKCNEGRNQPLQILKAVNTVLFKKKGFIRSNPFGNPQSSYLDQIFIRGSGTGVMLSIIYMEICQRLGLEVNGAAVGQEFVVWPVLDGCAQMVFEPCKGGKSWMLEHNEISFLPRSALSEQSKSLPVSTGSTTDIGLLRSLEPASKRDILGIVLRNLKTVYWKRASRARPGLTISAPLQLPGAGQHDSNAGKMNLPVGALLRPQDLRLSILASERLLLLEPRNWVLRKEHGLLLYHSRRYSEAVQELSICMALAPVHEEAMLQPFVERLHLMRLAESWGMLSSPNAPSALV